MGAASEAGKAEFAKVGVTGIKGVMEHGAAGFFVGAFVAIVTGALAGADAGIGVDLDGGANRITGGEGAERAEIAAPDFALKEEAEYDGHEHQG